MAVALGTTVRRLRPADAPEVADLLAVAFAEEFEGAGTDLSLLVRQLRTGSWTQRAPMRWVAPALGVEFAFFVAVSGRRVVGCAGIMGRRLPVINSVAVRPELRRRGIAEALMHTAESFAAEHGHDRVVLDVLAHNVPACALYAKLGYQEYHRYRAYVRPSGSGTAGDAGVSVQVTPRANADRIGYAALPWPLHGLPRGYRLAPPRRTTVEAFARVERAALPARFRAIAPTLQARYTVGPPGFVERLVAGGYSYRRVLLGPGGVAGYISGHYGSGPREARIDYPLIPAEHIAALPGVLADAIAFLSRYGATSVRVDVSEDRPDQHEVLEQLGFTHRWTFIQMVKQLGGRIRIPVTYGGDGADAGV
jgi:ribosomal protein S18 acetylase RimI-like enzyme